jgi:hypothetical protein
MITQLNQSPFKLFSKKNVVWNVPESVTGGRFPRARPQPPRRKKTRL